MRVTDQEFKARILNKFGTGVVPLEKYQGSMTKIKFRCNHGHIFKCEPHVILRHKHNGCPICNRHYSGPKTFSDEKFKLKLKHRFGNQVKPLEKYKGNNVKIKFKCYKGHVFYRRPRLFFENRRVHYCPICAQKIMGHKRHFTEQVTNRQFLKRLHAVHGNRITPLEKYKGRYVKIWFKCPKGHKFFTMPNGLLNGEYCPICSHHKQGLARRKTTNQFKQDVFNQVGNEYSVLSKYKTNTTPVLMKHNKCGRIFKVTPVEFLYNNVRCPNLSPSHKRTLNEFKAEVKHLVGNEFSVLGTKYVNNRTPIKMRHNKCGHTFMVRPDDFARHANCPICQNCTHMTTKLFKQRVHSLLGDQYTVLGRYVDAHTKIKVRHNKCGSVFLTRPDMFLRGERCPKCASSHGEHCVGKFLKQHHLNYIHGYRLHTSKIPVRRLHLDFYLPKYNVGIEFDGLQHFIPIDIWGGKKTFLQLKHRDKRKNVYCKAHRIYLIRIEEYHKGADTIAISKLVDKVLTKKLLPLLTSN